MYFQITFDSKKIKDKCLDTLTTIIAFIVRPFITKRRKRAIQIYLQRKYLKERRDQINRIFGKTNHK